MEEGRKVNEEESTNIVGDRENAEEEKKHGGVEGNQSEKRRRR